MLSMYDNPSMHRALAAGAMGYVLKEAPAEEIVDAILAVAAGRSFLGTGLVAQHPRRRRAPDAVAARERDPAPGWHAGWRAGRSPRSGHERAHRRDASPEHSAASSTWAAKAELIKYAVERCSDPAA